MQPRALTFDVSGNTGWAFGYPDMPRPMWGVFTVSDEAWVKRQEHELLRFYAFVCDLIDTHAPNVIAFEKNFTDLEAFSPIFQEISLGLIAMIKLAAAQRAITLYSVDNRHWFKVFTGQERTASSRAGKSQRQLDQEKRGRREARKQASIDAAVARNWYVANDDEADALGIMVYVLAQLDRTFNSRHGDRGPLFRRLEMQADREAMTK